MSSASRISHARHPHRSQQAARRRAALGHNRYHPDIAPVARSRRGRGSRLETRDALDGQIRPGTTVADLANLDAGARASADRAGLRQGRRAGRHARDRIRRHRSAADRIQRHHARPGLSARRDDRRRFWCSGRSATAGPPRQQLPGVRIPGAPFMGISGVAPVGAEAQGMDRARAARARAGGFVLPPDPDGAVPGGACGLARPAHAAAARERRQFRRQAAHQGRQAVPAGLRRGRAVLDRRRPFRPGRRRGLRHRGRDGRHRRGALQGAQRPRHQAEIRRRRCFAHPGYFPDPKFAAPRAISSP